MQIQPLARPKARLPRLGRAVWSLLVVLLVIAGTGVSASAQSGPAWQDHGAPTGTPPKPAAGRPPGPVALFPPPEIDESAPPDLDAIDAWIDAALAPMDDPAVVHADWIGGEADYEAIEGSITRPLTTLGEVGGALAWFGRGCDGDAAEQDVRGRVALVARGTCAFGPKILNAQKAGAVAILVFSDARPRVAMGGVASGVEIPGAMIDNAPGLELRDRLVAGTDVTVDLKPFGPPNDPMAATDQCVTTAMGDVTPGASIAVARGGRIIYAKGYGVKHLENGGTVDPETMFRIASITKQMTAAAVMQQVEAGKIDLDAPVTAYLPDLTLRPPWRASDITVRHLLTHSSGLADAYELTGPQTPGALFKWTRRLSGWVVHADPGSFYNYSNPGFSLAGAIVEQVTGVPFHEYVRDHVWRPAGMPLTTMLPADVVAHGDYSFGHSGTLRYAPGDYDNWEYAPAGGGWSTPSELVTWASLLMRNGGSVLSAASARAMQSPQIAGEGPTDQYGYGISIDSYRGTEVRRHGGSLPGWSGTIVLWAPESDLAVAVLHNSDTSISVAGFCALRQFLDLPRPWPLPDYRTDPAGWGRYSGTYAMADGAGRRWTADVAYTSGALTYAVSTLDNPGPPTPLAQQYLNTFNIQGGTTNIDFRPGKDAPGSVKWIRNRGFVGLRVGRVPERLALVPGHCTPLTIDAALDMPQLAIRAFGLSPDTPERLTGLAAHQDIPGDRSSASFKRDLSFSTEVGALLVRLKGQADDDLDLFVMHDANGDGSFTYPDERLVEGASATAQEQVDAIGPFPPGRYQIWVQGFAVNGEGSTFDLEYRAIAGHNLSLDGAPKALAAGQSATFRVCAEKLAPRQPASTGFISIDFGYAPRAIIVPVRWQPPAALFLPAAFRGVEIP